MIFSTKSFHTLTGRSFFIAALVASPAAWSQPTVEFATDCTSDAVTCLDQGWSENQRSWWYTTTQGSRLLPLSWALALKTEDGRQAMFGSEHLGALGYLSNPVSQENPYGLPVGFVVDHEPSRSADLMCVDFPETCLSRTMRDPWLGLNCSACHTAEIEHDGTRLRVDGAPTDADFTGLVDGTEDALRALLSDGDRFSDFADQVLGGVDDAQANASLVLQVSEQVAWFEKLRGINHGTVDAGPARLDAQGHILTKLSLVNGAKNPSREFASDAPASYPFIWNTYQQSQLQWNGIAKDVLKIPLAGRVTDIGALLRNTTEVIGVFAHIEANRGHAARGYDSSVRVREMVGLERLLSQMESPQWPEDVLGPIDQALFDRGAKLFEQECRECHAHLSPTDLRTPANDTMIDLHESGTDVFLACNTYLRTTEAGNMKNQRTFGLFGTKIKAEDNIHLMLVNASVGAVFGKISELASTVFDQIEPEFDPGDAAMMIPAPGEYLPDVADEVKKARGTECLQADDPLLAYKSRPLNGIWATAPYLHNGSVPTLYDLLLPAKARNFVPRSETAAPEATGPFRPESFTVGSRQMDTVKVGFLPDPSPDAWTFNVRDADGNIIPGNSNAGHDYGNAQLSDEDRFALIEYMKGL